MQGEGGCLKRDKLEGVRGKEMLQKGEGSWRGPGGGTVRLVHREDG